METIPDFDLYRELEVDPTASRETIDAAWRSLVKRHHPDAVGDAERASERIRRLNVAHDWLADAQRRSFYDRHRRDDAARGVSRSGGVAAAVPPQPRRGDGRPPSATPVADTSAAVIPLWVILFGLVAVAVLAVLLVLMLRSGDPAPVAATPVTSPSSQSASSATPSEVAEPYDAQAEADAVFAGLPSRVNGVRLRGEAAGGERLQATGGGGGMTEFMSVLGREPADLAFGYKGGQTTSGDLLTVAGFRARETKPKALVDAFVAHTKKSDPDLKWSVKRHGGRSVWVSADVDEPAVLAYVWAGADEMFLVISNDARLAGAAIRLMGAS